MPKLKKLFNYGIAGMLMGLLVFLSRPANAYAAPAEYTDLIANAEYDEENNFYYIPEDDGILTADYTLPENTSFFWHGGNFTIPAGVTLTISEGSCFEMSSNAITGKNTLFLLEEGATIRILGEKEYDEYGALKTRLNFICVNAEINGTIESNVQGLDSSRADLRFNGTIHSDGPILCYEQSEITFLGGEYLANGNHILERKYEEAFEGIIEVYGGIFSKNMAGSTLAEGVEMKKLKDGTYEAVLIPTEDSSETDTQALTDTSFPNKIKSFFGSAVKKAKDVFQEAVIANGGMKEAWKKPEFIICMIMVLGILGGFLYYVYDFIRSPLKKKFKILVETVLVIVIVGGGLWLIWEYVTKDLNAQQALTRPEYSEDAEVTKTLITDNRSSMNDLEAYTPGIYQIGKDIEPGIYYFESDDLGAKIDPFYIYFSKTPDFQDKDIGLWVSRSYVEFESGWYVTVIGANFIEADQQAAYVPSMSEGIPIYPPGEYLVGKDLAPGTYSYEPANQETFWIDVRMTPITAKEVSWTSYDTTGENSYNMSSELTEFTVSEGQTITISPWSQALLTHIDE